MIDNSIYPDLFPYSEIVNIDSSKKPFEKIKFSCLIALLLIWAKRQNSEKKFCVCPRPKMIKAALIKVH